MTQTSTLTSKQQSNRNAARMILRDRYPEVMAEHGKLIQAYATKYACTVFEAAEDLARDSGLDGYGQLNFHAAAAELIEPYASTVVPPPDVSGKGLG